MMNVPYAIVIKLVTIKFMHDLMVVDAINLWGCILELEVPKQIRNTRLLLIQFRKGTA